jgi:hypothetical protein
MHVINQSQDRFAGKTTRYICDAFATRQIEPLLVVERDTEGTMLCARNINIQLDRTFRNLQVAISSTEEFARFTQPGRIIDSSCGHPARL